MADSSSQSQQDSDAHRPLSIFSCPSTPKLGYIPRELWPSPPGDHDTSDTPDTPAKRHQTESSTGKEDDTEATSNRISTPKNLDERSLLNDMQDYYYKNGSYPFADVEKLQEFYDECFKGRGIYDNALALSKKMDDLKSRFFDNMEKKLDGEDVEGTMDPIDKQIFNISCEIWGEKDPTEEDNNGSNDESDIRDSSTKEKSGDYETEGVNTNDSKPLFNTQNFLDESLKSQDPSAAWSISGGRAGKNQPERPLPKDDNDGSSSDTEMEEQEDAAIDLTRPLTGKEEIQILNQMINYFGKNDRFPDSGCEDEIKDFCTNWMKIKDSSVELEEMLLGKMAELRERFKTNYRKFDKDSHGINKMDEEILDLSNFIWAKELDEEEENRDYDDDQDS